MSGATLRRPAISAKQPKVLVLQAVRRSGISAQLFALTGIAWPWFRHTKHAGYLPMQYSLFSERKYMSLSTTAGVALNKLSSPGKLLAATW